MVEKTHAKGSSIRFTVKFVKFDVELYHTHYTFEVVGPNGISFNFRDRYSSIELI